MDPAKLQSFWQDRNGDLWKFYCPHCRAPRAIPYRPQPGGWRHYSQVGLTAAVFTLAAWPWFGLKGIVAFVPLWMAFEFFYRTRVRAALVCDRCGFDPFLYLTDVKKARQQVEAAVQRQLAKAKKVANGREGATDASAETTRDSSDFDANGADVPGGAGQA
jgi:hypothetical protein